MRREGKPRFLSQNGGRIRLSPNESWAGLRRRRESDQRPRFRSRHGQGRDLHQKIAFVFKDNFLFSGTIRENITFSNPDIDEKTLQKALKNACLDEFIASLDKGLDSEIGERGVLLSGGQKQRIAIARAFIKNAPILVLDEATSALDNKAEAVVQQAIDNLMKPHCFSNCPPPFNREKR